MDRTKGDECAEWLIRLLSDGSQRRPQEIIDLGEEAGFDRSMIYRTRAKMPEILNTRGRQHPDNRWQLDPFYEPQTRRSAEDQLAALNDWLAEHEPDVYWDTEDLDTAATIILVLERKPSRGRLIEMLAAELGLDVKVL